MSLFLHLNAFLAVELKEYSSKLYSEVLNKLKIFNLLYSTNDFRIINSSNLKSEQIYYDSDYQNLWSFPNNSTFVLTNEVGLKVVFYPNLHLEYISRKRTRQGFNLFLEDSNVPEDSKGAEKQKEITFKFFFEQSQEGRNEKEVFRSYETFVSYISSKYLISGKPFIHYNLLVINEFSEFFYLTNKNDFEILKVLYVGHYPAKYSIILKEPEKKIILCKKGEEFIFDYLESFEYFVNLLEKNPIIGKFDVFDINLKNEEVYSRLEHWTRINLTEYQVMKGSVNENCQCGGIKINGECIIYQCPINKRLRNSTRLK